MNRNTRDLAEAPIGSLLLRLSIPATVGTLVNATYNIVDRIFIGRYVGEAGLAAATVAFPVMILMMAFGMMIGYGHGAVISIRLGARDRQGAEEALGQGVAMYILLSLGFTVFGLVFLTPLLRLFGAGEAIIPEASGYLAIVLIGVLPHEISYGGNCFVRAEGALKWAMVTFIIGGGLNILLDALFLGVLGMGVKGAALATVLAQCVSSLWVLGFYAGKSTVKLSLRNIRIRGALAAEALAIGGPHFFINLANCVMQGLTIRRLATYGGDMAIAVAGVLFSINMMVILPLQGLAQGAQPVFGYNWGAGNFERVRRALFLSLAGATVVCLAGFAVTECFPAALLRPFARDANSELIVLGAAAVRRFMLLLPVVGILFISTTYFQSVGKPRYALLLHVLRQGVVGVPALLILPAFLGLNGVWYSTPVSTGAAFVPGLLMLLREVRTLRRHEATTDIPLSAIPTPSNSA